MYRIFPPVTWGSARGARGPYTSHRLPSLSEMDLPTRDERVMFLADTRAGVQLQDIVLLPVVGHRPPRKAVD